MAQLPHPRTTTFHRNEQLARTFSCSTDKGLNQLSSPGFLFNFIKSLSFPLFHTEGGWGSTLPLEGSLCNQKWGLAAQQSIKRSGWRNGKLAVFQMPGWHLWGRQPPLTLPVPPPQQQSGGRSFRSQREGAAGRNSTASSDRRLEIGHRWSDECHLDHFRYSWSSVPGLVCSRFLRPVLRMVAAFVMAMVWSSGS